MDRKKIVALLNTEIPTPIALTIIILFGAIVSGILIHQYSNIY